MTTITLWMLIIVGHPPAVIAKYETATACVVSHLSHYKEGQTLRCVKIEIVKGLENV